MSIEEAISVAEQAVADGHLTQAALENLKCWLTETRYQAYQSSIVQHIKDGK
jgi:hypothetical protein